MITFKKVSENCQGTVVDVFDNGTKIGSIEKWHGLFIGVDINGERFTPEEKRADLAERMRESVEFAAS